MSVQPIPFAIDITGNVDEIEILVGYLTLCEKCRKDLCELTFLKDFLEISTEDNPRHIIKYMFDKYTESTCIINEQPDLLIEFTFKFGLTEGAHDHYITLSNHMQFRNDILMICYVKYFLLTPRYLNKNLIVLRAMTLIMVIKYEIDIVSLYPEPYAITFMNISVSYLSISLDIFYNVFADFPQIISHLFSYFDDLPMMIYAPLIISVLPSTLNDPPIAILMVISLATIEVYLPQIVQNIPLATIYERIHSLNSMKIPEKMKLHLCARYNIVVLEGDEFKFAPCFARNRQKAKDVISQKRSNDPCLNAILSII